MSVVNDLVESDFSVEKSPFAKCERCWKCLPEVGRLWKWPELCARCADYMDTEYPHAEAFQRALEHHPLRLLAEDPCVPRLMVGWRDRRGLAAR